MKNIYLVCGLFFSFYSSTLSELSRKSSEESNCNTSDIIDKNSSNPTLCSNFHH